MNLKLKYYPYNLELKHQFTLSGSSRSHTPIILTELHYEDFIGYGEASLPPYLKENQTSVSQYLADLNSISFLNAQELVAIEKEISLDKNEHYAGKASLSIALLDLSGKMLNKPVRELLNLPFKDNCYTSYTIGIDSKEMIKTKVREAEYYPILKVKVGTENDLENIRTIYSLTKKPLYLDANQGWSQKEIALKEIEKFQKLNVKLIEQPFPVNAYDDQLWLKNRSPLPIIADESIRNITDLYNFWELFHGINIKLMKCGGISAALEMIHFCKEKNLKVMIGCMTETSCGISAAADLMAFADYIDLDGNILIKNDPFQGVETINGKIISKKKPGFGLSPR